MIHAAKALLEGGWRTDVRLTCDEGRIASVEVGVPARAGDRRVDCLLPGMPNVHSHAFQRGFSGLAQRRGAGRDSFWTWRDTMYRFALSVTPEDVEAIAAMAYVEMLEAGFTRVGEFHYLHHDRDGTPYDDPAELSARIFAAAHDTGLALTHLPVFYAHGGFGPVPAGKDQLRFLTSPDWFADLVVACDRLVVRPQDRVAYAPHSLRAVSAQELARLSVALPGRNVHVHVAEQMREVEECIAVHGQRPVARLLDICHVDQAWCLIHATHLDEAERKAVERSGAVAGLCPVTEADLGDGIFAARDFLGGGGRIGIGTDSNVRISVADELRMLEYGQRLVHRERNVLAGEGGSTGRRLFSEALRGGAQALGIDAPALTPGALADVVALRGEPRIGGDGDAILDCWIFGRGATVSDVWAAGVHLVHDGQHVGRAAIEARFARSMGRLSE